MRSLFLIALALSTTLGCASSDHARHAAAPGPTKELSAQEIQPSGDLSPLPAYVIAPHAFLADLGSGELSRFLRLAPPTPGADGGYLQNGVRFQIDSRSRLKLARARGIVDGVRVPQRFGGGFLFSSGESLYFSSTFLETPKPYFFLPSSGGGFSRISFGPDFVLVRGGDEERWFLSFPKGKPLPSPLVGLLDVAALDDGRALALLENGEARAFAGGEWRPVSAASAVLPFVAVDGDSDHVWLEDAKALRWGLGKDNGLSPLAKAPAPELNVASLGVDVPADWPLQQTPIERAVETGAMLDDRVALVEVAGSFARVDTRLGTVLGRTQPVLSSNFDEDRSQRKACQMYRLGDEVVAVCRHWQRTVVVEDAQASRPRVRFDYFNEREFVGGPRVLFSTGPCNSDVARPGAVCVREPGRDWFDADLPWLPPPALPSPAADPAAEAVAAAPSDADANAKKPEYWTSTASGSPAAVYEAGNHRYFVDLATHRPRWLDTSYREGNATYDPAAIDLQRHINDFGKIVTGVPKALLGDDNKLFVREEGTKAWRALPPPPIPVLNSEPTTWPCTGVGCRVGPLLLLAGLAPEEAPRSEPLPLADGPDFLPATEPELRCTEVGAPIDVPAPSGRAGREQPSPLAAREWFWNTPQIVFEQSKEDQSVPRKPKGLSFGGGNQAIVISDLSHSSAVGLLARDPQTSSWHSYRNGHFTEYDPKRPRYYEPWLKDATLLPGGNLAVLLEERDTSLTRVVMVAGDKAKPFWAIPAGSRRQLKSTESGEPIFVGSMREALALGPGGSLGVLRTERDGGKERALLLEPGHVPLELAPWSSLEPGASPACSKPAPEWRTVVSFEDVRFSGDANGRGYGHSVAAVRWRERRVCVDWLRSGDIELDAHFEGKLERSSYGHYGARSHRRRAETNQQVQRLHCVRVQPGKRDE